MVRQAEFVEDHGLKGDAHAGQGLRQVSLLSVEEIEKAEASCLKPEIDFHPGIFAENLTIEGLGLSGVRAGDIFHIGDEVILKVTQIGKECSSGCSIAKKIGRCIMPKQGIFAIVEKGGFVKVGDRIRLQKERASFLLSWSKK